MKSTLRTLLLLLILLTQTGCTELVTSILIPSLVEQVGNSAERSYTK